MIDRHFVLIAGRTSKQGCGISEGKQAATYLADTTVVRASPEDMTALGLSDGEQVRLRATSGEVVLPIVAATGGDVPPGILFIAYGDSSCRLMSSDTHGSGMPTSKGIDVLLEELA